MVGKYSKSHGCYGIFYQPYKIQAKDRSANDELNYWTSVMQEDTPQ